MKKCPYCAEEIQDAAVKCKHCGEFLDVLLRESNLAKADDRPKQESRVKWYFRTYYIGILFLCITPFGFLILPLVWMNPHYSKKKKIIMIIIMLILSVIFFKLTFALMDQVKDTLKQMRDLGFPI